MARIQIEIEIAYTYNIGAANYDSICENDADEDKYHSSGSYSIGGTYIKDTFR